MRLAALRAWQPGFMTRVAPDGEGAPPAVTAGGWTARWHLLVLVALLAAFAVTAARSADRPVLFDETNFMFQARAIAETGIPHANMGYMGDRGRVTTREYYGLWHPPLYLYLLGLDVKLFGTDEMGVRLPGVVLMLGTALLVYGLGHTLAGGGGRGRACGLLATGLFLASPLVAQSAVVIDIDGTLLLFVVTAWVLLYLRWQQTTTLWRLAALGALLTLGLWTKMTTPLALVGAVIVYQALAGRWLLGLRQVAVIVGVGVPLFLATWWLVAAIVGLPFEMPFQWLAWELFDASKYTRSWLGDPVRMRGELAPGLAWASPYLVGAFGALVVARVAAWTRTRRAEPVDLLIVLGGVIFAAYFIKLAANFPKYHVGMLPFWSAALAWWLVDWLSALEGRARLALAAGAALACGYFLATVGDAWQFTPTLVWEAPIIVPALALFLVAAAAAVLTRAPALGALAGGLVAPLVLLFVGWGLAVSATQAGANYSTNYYYGTHGQREAAAALDAIGYDGTWIGAKEVAWYARNQRYIDADTFWWLVIVDGLRFDGTLLGEDVRVLVPWTTDPEVRDFFWRQLDGRYEQVGPISDYTVWVRREGGASVAQVPVGDSAGAPRGTP
jgi:4-amino-4-deoxy-L-arabinose transferase-like glycosyltransferase